MVFDPGKIILRGRDVTLRPLERTDAPELAITAAESREQYRFTIVPSDPAEAYQYIERAIEQRNEGQRYPFAVVFLGRVVGSTSYLDLRPWDWPAGSAMARPNRPDACEIGATWLANSAQQTRCNTEAKFLLLSHAFEKWDVHRVSLQTDARNERSRRAIERLGAKFDGILRAHKAASDGAVRDSAFYSILAAEWPAVRERLSGFLARDATVR
ncbi:MAG TPA: GNAT family protein [Tepidisphaeraceae bacterium]|jgi:RimJ/RimL family protein N-acetyltransferase|nr:GNAT family protein [Tepidisphaeraceae bacterium]